MKLALAAVDATDCAMDGTVNCARREDGRPERTGIPSAVIGGAAVTDLLSDSAGLAITSALILVLTSSDFFLDGETTGFAATEGSGTLAGLEASPDVPGLAGVGAALLVAGLASGAGLATGLGALDLGATGAAGTWALTGLPGAAVLLTATSCLTACAFTVDLLAGFTCTSGTGVTTGSARTVESAGLVTFDKVLSSARECTGLAEEKPISCKSETNMMNPDSG